MRKSIIRENDKYAYWHLPKICKEYISLNVFEEKLVTIIIRLDQLQNR